MGCRHTGTTCDCSSVTLLDAQEAADQIAVAGTTTVAIPGTYDTGSGTGLAAMTHVPGLQLVSGWLRLVNGPPGGFWFIVEELSDSGVGAAPATVRWARWCGINELMDVSHFVRGRAFRMFLFNPSATALDVRGHLVARAARAVAPDARYGDSETQVYTDTGNVVVAAGGDLMSPVFCSADVQKLQLAWPPTPAPVVDHNGAEVMYQVHSPLYDYVLQTNGGGAGADLIAEGGNDPSLGASPVPMQTVPVGGAGVVDSLSARLVSAGVAQIHTRSILTFYRLRFHNGTAGPITARLAVRAGGRY